MHRIRNVNTLCQSYSASHLTIAGLRVGSRYRRSVPSAKMMPVRVKFLILIIFRTRFPAPPPFLEDHQCEPSKNEARNKADNLAKGFKHSAFAVRAGCFGRSIDEFAIKISHVILSFGYLPIETVSPSCESCAV